MGISPELPMQLNPGVVPTKQRSNPDQVRMQFGDKSRLDLRGDGVKLGSGSARVRNEKERCVRVRKHVAANAEVIIGLEYLFMPYARVIHECPC